MNAEAYLVLFLKISACFRMFKNGLSLYLTGKESDDVFKVDYIDPSSDLPTLHLSFLLKIIIPESIVRLSAISSASASKSQMIFSTSQVTFLNKYVKGR